MKYTDIDRHYGGTTMSHSATYGKYYVTHNRDFSGDIKICTQQAPNEEEMERYVEIARLPYWLLAEIVAAKVRQNRIRAIEDAGPDELLK